MAQAIRVVVTRTYTYVPDLTELDYKVNGINSLADALEYDRQDYVDGEVSLEELVVNSPIETAVWSVIDE